MKSNYVNSIEYPFDFQPLKHIQTDLSKGFPPFSEFKSTGFGLDKVIVRAVDVDMIEYDTNEIEEVDIYEEDDFEECQNYYRINESFYPKRKYQYFKEENKFLGVIKLEVYTDNKTYIIKTLKKDLEGIVNKILTIGLTERDEAFLKTAT